MNERYETFVTRATVKLDIKSNVWDCISAYGVINLCLIQGNMDRWQQNNILRNQLQPSIQILFGDLTYIFQLDNDSKHFANVNRAWTQLHLKEILPWLTQSPDLNPIENLWSMLDRRCKTRAPNTVQDLFQIIPNEWNHLPATATTTTTQLLIQ